MWVFEVVMDMSDLYILLKYDDKFDIYLVIFTVGIIFRIWIF